MVPAQSRQPGRAVAAVRAGLGYLAALDPAQLPAWRQAELLQLLEQAHALETAARTGVLGGFTTAQGYHEDGDYSPRSWPMQPHRDHQGRRHRPYPVG